MAGRDIAALRRRRGQCRVTRRFLLDQNGVGDAPRIRNVKRNQRRGRGSGTDERESAIFPRCGYKGALVIRVSTDEKGQ